MTYSIPVLETGARALRRLVMLELPLDRPRIERELHRVGCSARHSDAVLAMLEDGGLMVRASDSRLSLSTAGVEVAKALVARDWWPYVRRLMTLDYMKAQLELGLGAVREHEGSMVIDRSALPSTAGELSVVLGWVPAVGGVGTLAPLDDGWLSTMQLSDRPEPRDWVTRNELVGDRAERYSLLLLRSVYPPDCVGWVAAESDRYGYDIEVRQEVGDLAIEVKGSTSSSATFFLSRRERSVATDRGHQYVIHFWGEIDLSERSLDDYKRLRSEGYPVTFVDPEALIADGQLQAVAESWRVLAGSEPLP